MLRITLHNAFTQLPHRKPLESGHAFVAQRCQSFTHAIQMYYEILDMPLEELEKLKALRVKMVKANTELVRQLTVRLAPTATITDLLDKVCNALILPVCYNANQTGSNRLATPEPNSWLHSWYHPSCGCRVQPHELCNCF